MVVVIGEKDGQVYKEKRVDQDGLWKKVVGELFEDFIQFFMPELHANIDFSKKVEFMDKELYQEVIDQQKGRNYADNLVKVQMKSGKSKWVLVHVEVQSSGETDFPMRMFKYFYRIYDRYEEEIIALAVHTFRGNIDKMMQFEYAFFGTKLNYSYNNYRTEDYSDEELAQSSNIFSRVVLAAKAMHATKGKMKERYQFKFKLMRELIGSKIYSRPAIVATIYFIDYLLQLPEEEANKLSREIGPEIRKEREFMELYNDNNASPTVYKSFAEQLDQMEEKVEKSKQEGIERGIEQGIEQGVEQGIDLNKKETAMKMLHMRLDLVLISEVTGLPVEKLQVLEKEIKHGNEDN